MNTRRSAIDQLASSGSWSSFAGILAAKVLCSTKEDQLQFCDDVALALANSNISEIEKSTRFKFLISVFGFSNLELRQLAIRGRNFSAAVKNALASALPPDLKPMLYATQQPSAHSGQESNQHRTEAKEQSATAQVTESVAEADSDPSFSGVLVFSSDDQEGNFGLLRKHGFHPTRIRSLQELSSLLGPEADICGCIVDSSFSKQLGTNAQREALARIAELSSFIWVRVQDEGLLISQDQIIDLFRDTRCDPSGPKADQLNFRGESLLREFELPALKNARRRLCARSRMNLAPGELTPSQAMVLISAVEKALHYRNLNRTLRVKSLRTRFLTGGKTTAKIATVEIDESHIPFIAKIDSTQNVMDEHRRFISYIQQSDPELRPELHFHSDVGVIIFGLVPANSGSFQPAPTLHDSLERFWRDELYNPGSDLENKREDLVRAITSAVQKISRINKRAPEMNDVQEFCYPHIRDVVAAEERGKAWGFAAGALGRRSDAITIFERMRGKSTVHGDVHLHNILVRSDREAHLIDYAASGPGHPAQDLIRLELALYFSAFRQVGDAVECVALQREINNPAIKYHSLIEKFDQLASWDFNRVCISGMLSARDEALVLLNRFGGGLEDYLAAKLLFAWNSLLVSSLNGGLCRSVIHALS